MSIHPYLFFAGNCREAFTYYEKVFGGELQLVTAADVPGDDPVPPEMADAVLHASLQFGGDNLLMGSDSMDDATTSVQGIMVNFTGPEAECRRVFDSLAEGGSVTQPLIETFFSSAFGMCVDRFGTPWMVVADGEPASSR